MSHNQQSPKNVAPSERPKDPRTVNVAGPNPEARSKNVARERQAKKLKLTPKPPLQRYATQEDRYRHNPGMVPYETELGGSPLNVSEVEDFVALTDPERDPLFRENEKYREILEKRRKMPWQQAHAEREQDFEQAKKGVIPPVENVAPPEAEAKAAEEPPPRRNGRCTAQVFRERIYLIKKCLVEGYSVSAICALFKQSFGLGRRSTQLYIQRAKAQFAADASEEDYLAHLQISKLQTERLYELTMRDYEAIKDPIKRIALLRVAKDLIKQRDLAMASILEHRKYSKRDKSPDGEQKRLARGRIIKMTADELAERNEHMRNNWWHEWTSNLEQLIAAVGLADKVPAEFKPIVQQFGQHMQNWMFQHNIENAEAVERSMTGEFAPPTWRFTPDFRKKDGTARESAS